MEKISGIIRGSARVASADTQKAPSARPGMPAFGRPVGESTAGVPVTSSTADRAVALHNGLTEAKKAVSQERVLSKMADEFFMSRVRRPEEREVETIEIQVPEMHEQEIETPAQEYTPRGSFVDVRA